MRKIKTDEGITSEENEFIKTLTYLFNVNEKKKGTYLKISTVYSNLIMITFAY